MKLKNLTVASLTALLLVGCGSGSSSTATETADLPVEKTLVFFDNATSSQYLYDTETKTLQDMNADTTKAYNMTAKNGQLYTWKHEVSEGVHEQKIAMINDDVALGETNLTQANYVYLAHLHEETNGTHEFEADINSDVNASTLTALNSSLATYKTVKQEIASALPSSETLCNFIVLGDAHEEHNTTSTTTEVQPHIALTNSGKIYIYQEDNTSHELTLAQTVFTLDGISNCEEKKSSMVQTEEYGMMVFSAESQTVYVVDSHDGADFHEHSKSKVSLFLPSGFTPTQLAITGESNETAHDH